jgi:hypothetical protein
VFDVILRELMESVPGTRGIVFCDSQGETVNSLGASGRDAPGLLYDFDLRVAGAQLAEPLDLAQANARETLGSVRECVISGGSEIMLVHTLPDGYYLLMCLQPGALVARAMQHLRHTAKRVAVEML